LIIGRSEKTLIFLCFLGHDLTLIANKNTH